MTKDKLILALDVAGAAEAREIVAELGGAVGAFKIGLQLFTAAGPDLVRELTRKGHRIFLDLKFHDIPNTVAKASVEAARLGVWMFNLHTLGGHEMMRQAADEVSETCGRENLAKPLIIGVTVLTSSDAGTLTEIGIERSVEDEVLALARLAEEAGLDGVVASPIESHAVRRSKIGSAFLIVTPGVRPDSATNDDQKRVTTPGAALSGGSDYIVVGRPILRAKNRSAAASAIVESMTSVV
ncbi:MAG: orotidine-5'-phosphate decarboxylase [Pyrinomonadaceae bacterium]